MFKIPSRRRLKKIINRKLIYYPFLRMLLLKVWFRVAFLILACTVSFMALMLPKVWTSSPPGFLPVVKISGLDLLQAWSLQRTAHRLMAASRENDASYSWQAAIANNPADRGLLRGFIEHLVVSEDIEARYIRNGIGYSLWLLRLTQTNAIDLDLATRLNERFRNYELLIHLLEPREAALSPQQQTVYLKALFSRGAILKFASLWDQWQAQTLLDSELPLYRAAYDAGWGQPEDAASSRPFLDENLDSPEHRILANRLYLLVSGHLHDIARYETSLEKLVEFHEDTLLDHAGYWNLLITTGQKERARELAQAYPNVPTSAVETTQLALTYTRLGLTENAIQFLSQFAAPFAYSEQVWILYATLLLDGERWEELRAMSLHLRQLAPQQPGLLAYSYFLEGRAELGLYRTVPAEQAFNRIPEFKIENSALGLRIGHALHEFGYSRLARLVLAPLESAQRSNIAYWDALFEVALNLKDPALILFATEHAYNLDPGDVHVINRYAAALLVNQIKPELAVNLTLQLISAFPNSLASTINHSLALLMNRRIDEAERLLNGVDPDRLTPDQLTSFHLAWFELHRAAGNTNLAREAYDKIDPQHLLPIQAERAHRHLRQFELLPVNAG